MPRLGLKRPGGLFISYRWLPLRGPAASLSVLRCAYDVAWAVLVTGYLVVRAALGGKPSACAARQRLGHLPRRPLIASRAVWVHAASLGELLALQPILVLLRRELPGCWVLLTCQHDVGDVVRSRAIAVDAFSLMPWDFGPLVDRALRRVRPDLLILAECELWPNLILAAARSGTRMLMVNARIYEADLPRYLAARGLFGPLLRQVSYIGVRTPADRDRFCRLGAAATSITVVGDTRFDVSLPADTAARLDILRRQLPLGCGPLWILASTHPGEELQILRRVRPLKEQFANLQLVVAPRQPRRAGQILRMAEKSGLRTVLRSRPVRRDTGGPPPDVIVLDTQGELALALGVADLVFIGGSLVALGGHNPIEAAVHARAILIGPSVFHFADAVAALLTQDAMVQVEDFDELIRAAQALFPDPGRRERLGARAAETVRRHEGTSRIYARAALKLAGHARLLASPSRAVRDGRKESGLAPPAVPC